MYTQKNDIVFHHQQKHYSVRTTQYRPTKSTTAQQHDGLPINCLMLISCHESVSQNLSHINVISVYIKWLPKYRQDILKIRKSIQYSIRTRQNYNIATVVRSFTQMSARQINYQLLQVHNNIISFVPEVHKTHH